MNKLSFAGEMVEIVFQDDQASCEGILCKTGEKFSAFYIINNWCVDGLGVFPNDRIKSCNRDDYLVEREKIVFWKGIETDDTYEWIELDSSLSLFNSIYKRNKGIYVADDDDAEVGIILSVNTDYLTIKGINGAGNYLPDDIEFPFSEVCSVYIDDMYGKTLIEYAASLLNRPGFAEGSMV